MAGASSARSAHHLDASSRQATFAGDAGGISLRAWRENGINWRMAELASARLKIRRVGSVFWRACGRASAGVARGIGACGGIGAAAATSARASAAGVKKMHQQPAAHAVPRA